MLQPPRHQPLRHVRYCGDDAKHGDTQRKDVCSYCPSPTATSLLSALSTYAEAPQYGGSVVPRARPASRSLQWRPLLSTSSAPCTAPHLSHTRGRLWWHRLLENGRDAVEAACPCASAGAGACPRGLRPHRRHIFTHTSSHPKSTSPTSPAVRCARIPSMNARSP